MAISSVSQHHTRAAQVPDPRLTLTHTDSHITPLSQSRVSVLCDEWRCLDDSACRPTAGEGCSSLMTASLSSHTAPPPPASTIHAASLYASCAAACPTSNQA